MSTPAETSADDTQPAPWWSDAVFYQVYPRSFADANGDGVGDLQGVRDKLGYLELLGVDALWLSPVMRSPMADHGYDVSDPRDIDPLFGDLEVMDDLIEAAHARQIKVTMDLVPNHTSVEHDWFRAAVASSPGSPERNRYIFRDGRGENGAEPPNNWPSIFGGPAWTRITEADGTPGQWYLHIFAAEQPDLNWDNPEVVEDLTKTLRFWLDRGIDGFRIDVAHGMAKPEGLPDHDWSANELLHNSDDDPRFDNPAVHDIHRGIRKILDEYPGTVAVGPDVLAEAFVVANPDLPDRHRARVLVEHLADAAMDVVDRGVVEPRIVIRVLQQFVGGPVMVRQTFRLGHAVRDVDAESVDAAVQPEPERLREILDDLRIVPVQVGLFRRENVQVPLARLAVGLGDPRPRRPAEDARPVVGRLRAVLTATVAEDVPVPFGTAGRRRQGGAEPFVLDAGVIGHQIHRHLDLPRVRGLDQLVHGREVTEQRVDVTGIGHVVTVIGHRRAHDRAQPEGVDTEQFEVSQLVPHSVEVADTVTVRVGERAGIDLVEDGVGPPGCRLRVVGGRFGGSAHKRPSCQTIARTTTRPA